MKRGVSPLTIAVAVALFALTVVVAMVGQKDIGIARDEATYMHFGSRYADWWAGVVGGSIQPTNEEAITAHFGGPRATDGNREHPPLMKTLFGLSHRLLHRGLGWLPEQAAYRLPTALMFAVLVVLVYAFARRHFGAVEAVTAAVLVLACPRLLFHGSLATFDVPVVTMWFATLFAYDKVLHAGAKPIVLGVVFGLALATKHNALMLPAVIGAHYLWVVYRDVAGAQGWRGRTTIAFVRGLWALKPSIALALLAGPVVLVALWPWLWFDTFAHASQWIAFHLDHVHYNFEYLGTNYNAPPFPWHIAIVTLLVTVPLVTLVAAGLGVGECMRRFRVGERIEDAPAMLIFLSAAVAIGPFLLPTTPIFGATKHYAAVVPSLCIFAGVGVAGSARLLVRALGRGSFETVAIALALLVALASAAEARSSHPYGLSHYTSIAGGPAGGADLGMNRQFWGTSALGVLAEIERRTAKLDGQVPVYTHDAAPAWPWYQRFGSIDRRIIDAGHEQAGVRRSKLALVIHERHFNRHDYMIWEAYGTVQPVFVLTVAGVPLVSLYERPELAAPSP